jgi:hypothetical protein
MALVVSARDGRLQSGFRYELSSAQMGVMGCIDACKLRYPFPHQDFLYLI